VQSVEGRLTRTVYVVPEGRSTLEVVRNYTNDLEAKGAKTLFQCSKLECGEEFHKLHGVPRALKPEGTAYDRTRRDLTANVLEYVDPNADQRLWVGQWTREGAGDVYVSIYAATQTGGSNGDTSTALKGHVLVMLDVLETKAMQQNLAFVSAEQIGGALGKDGRVALYGILFDFDKADIKPESDKQLAEMANLLKSSAGLKVFIVGHTDNKGALAYNTDLSQRRADSVAKALATRFGIAADRMVSKGVGPLSPLASNDTEDGQAKNRRVELVRQ
jgi:OOP family OmpA-OmpF porin